jgi:hypothetical protein
MLKKDGRIRQAGGTWALMAHRVKVPRGLERHIRTIGDFLKASGLRAPPVSGLSAVAAENGMDERTLRQVLEYLSSNGTACRIEGEYLHSSIVDTCRRTLLEKLAVTPGGLTVAAFRDLIGGNRKICLLLFALFDKEGSTVRQGDVRVITEKGRQMII